MKLRLNGHCSSSLPAYLELKKKYFHLIIERLMSLPLSRCLSDLEVDSLILRITPLKCSKLPRLTNSQDAVIERMGVAFREPIFVEIKQLAPEKRQGRWQRIWVAFLHYWFIIWHNCNISTGRARSIKIQNSEPYQVPNGTIKGTSRCISPEKYTYYKQ